MGRRQRELAFPWRACCGVDEIRAHGLADRRGFGSVRVEARLGDVVWRTSLFPLKDGGYILPVKAEVRRKAGIAAGDEVTVTLELL